MNSVLQADLTPMPPITVEQVFTEVCRCYEGRSAALPLDHQAA